LRRLCAVDNTRPQKKKATQEYLDPEAGLEIEMWTVAFRYSWRKTEAAVRDGAGGDRWYETGGLWHMIHLSDKA